MNILLAHITQNIGGVEKRFFEYSKYILKSADNNYTVLLSRSLIRTINVDVVCSKNNRLIKYGFPWKVKNKITRYIDYMYLVVVLLLNSCKKFDVAHFPTTTSLIFSRLINANKKVYSVVISELTGLNRILMSDRFSNIMESGYFIDCLDTNIRQHIVTRFPAQSRNIFSTPCSFIEYLDTEVNPNEKENAVCFVGRLVDFKGISLLINTMLDIINNTNYDIYILGHGVFEQNIRLIIDENKLTSRVFLTYCKDPKLYLKKSKIFLSLQRDENYPSQSLLEAMACGNVVIATNVGLTHTIVKPSFGVLINYNETELYNAMTSLVSGAYDLAGMGINAREFAMTNHTIERFHQYLMSVYN